ncbi:phosphoethanolamine transferase [Mannheimia haemolytica]|nr:phosphoethanolamine transferase [Mannheimia haemolytica]STY62396.1 Phosphoethanolamine transferase eptA [Mannheimia haemolytica]
MVTKRLSGRYFHEIPIEIISIVYDTNLDELQSNSYFNNIEIAGVCLIFVPLLFLFRLKFTRITKQVCLIFFIQLLFISTSIYFNTPIKQTFEKIAKDRESISESLSRIKAQNNFKWGATSLEDEDQVVVLFLGETHRGDYLSINGYPKDTTPRLLQHQVISFSNAISQAAYTLVSTPMMLSRKDVEDKGIYHEKSLISAFKEAGFETWYVSYLSNTHIGDNEINIITNEAHHYIRSSVNNDTLKNILSHSAKKKLIVYKTVGSHYLFHTRYPNKYSNLFVPAFTDKDYKIPTIKDKERIENSYLNSIRFSVDDQISDFIDILSKEKGIVSLSFISDHGTAIYDDSVSLYGGNTKGNYNIALFFWFNDRYKEKNPEDVLLLNENKHKKVSSKYLVDTMFHIGKIKTEKIKGFSLFEKDLTEKPRFVINKDIYNYDSDIK